jgi:hypothetical protein
MINNDRWYESFGETVKKMANVPITDIELGKTMEIIYQRIVKEAERDSRETFNREQHLTSSPDKLRATN